MEVSSKTTPDKIKVTFNDPNLFIASNGLVMESEKMVIEKFLPT